jgi:hypothetical protein
MQTERNADTDDESGLAIPKRWVALPIVIAGGVAAVCTGQFSSLAVAEGTGLTVMVTLFTAMHWWPLRRFPIAWIVTASVMIIHLLVVFTLPWPHQDRASKAILLILVVDIFGVILISGWLERRSRVGRRSDNIDGS